MSDGAIKLTNLVTGGFNGFGSRYFAKSGNLNNGFIGALEGLYLAHYWGNSDKVMGLGSNFSITGRLASSFLTQSTTSIPGLGLTIASYHAQFASARMFLPNAQWITPTVFDRLGIGGSLMPLELMVGWHEMYLHIAGVMGLYGTLARRWTENYPAVIRPGSW